MNIDLPPPVRRLLGALGKRGHEAYIVGGCVRDSLMGREPSDWDVATSATPAEIKSCFPHTFDTGIAHGTVTVVLGGANYEVTTYRTDGEYLDGRRPKSVSFSASIYEDLARRDFTMNAIAWRPGGGLADPFGGAGDIEGKTIRCVGDPNLRFREDALRMMRAARFAGQLGFDIDSGTLAAIRRNAGGLARISAERVRDELTKLLLSPRPEKLSLLAETGLLGDGWPVPMKPGADEIAVAARFLPECPKKAAFVYAVLLFGRGADEVFQSLNALRFDKATCREASLLVKWAKTPIPGCCHGLRKYLSLCGASNFQGILALKKLMKTGDCAELPIAGGRFRRIMENGDCLSVQGLKITGGDLLELGFKGKAVGMALDSLLEAVLREPGLNNPGDLRRLARCYGSHG